MSFVRPHPPPPGQIRPDYPISVGVANQSDQPASVACNGGRSRLSCPRLLPCACTGGWALPVGSAAVGRRSINRTWCTAWSRASPSPPASALPPLVGDRLVGFDFQTAAPIEVLSPVLVPVGRPLALMAVPTLHAGLSDLRLTFEWRFGDGVIAAARADQQVAHGYTTAGVYTIAAIVTDATGIQTFGVTRIRIAPA